MVTSKNWKSGPGIFHNVSLCLNISSEQSKSFLNKPSRSTSTLIVCCLTINLYTLHWLDNKLSKNGTC